MADAAAMAVTNSTDSLRRRPLLDRIVGGISWGSLRSSWDTSRHVSPSFKD